MADHYQEGGQLAAVGIGIFNSIALARIVELDTVEGSPCDSFLRSLGAVGAHHGMAQSVNVGLIS